ncbi:MAG: hypothetical protein FWC00_03585 [Firmicutes bacterium]|nr:hypothetical protein [Bacillota bacterium]
MNQDVVLEFIRQVFKKEEEARRNAKDVYLGGNCGNLFRLLKSEFPEAIAYHVKFKRGHIVTLIQDKFYDINGVFDPNEILGYEWQEYMSEATEYDIVRCSDNYGKPGFRGYVEPTPTRAEKLKRFFASVKQNVQNIFNVE